LLLGMHRNRTHSSPRPAPFHIRCTKGSRDDDHVDWKTQRQSKIDLKTSYAAALNHTFADTCNWSANDTCNVAELDVKKYDVYHADAFHQLLSEEASVFRSFPNGCGRDYDPNSM